MGDELLSALTPFTTPHTIATDEAGAQQLTLRLGGTWYRTYGTAPCPVCQPERDRSQNALTLADGHHRRLLLNCKKSGCSFNDILCATGIRRGDYSPPDPLLAAQREAEARAHAEKKEQQAFALWNEARSIQGTIAETYLMRRGITGDLPATLRFHPEAWHPTAKRLPAMLARIDGPNGFAVHRTYLNADGNGKAHAVPAKAMLGMVKGGAVRLTEACGPLVVSEGIETGLSLACGLLRLPATIWATLSTAGMVGLRLPDQPHRLTIATDGDEAGRRAGIDLARRATALGWKVSTLPAPNGRDWNDVLAMKGAKR